MFDIMCSSVSKINEPNKTQLLIAPAVLILVIFQLWISNRIRVDFFFTLAFKTKITKNDSSSRVLSIHILFYFQLLKKKKN